MPTVLRVDGYEIVIYFLDHWPPHVHVFVRGGEVIVFLDCPRGTPTIREYYRMRPRELKAALGIVEQHHEHLCSMWKEIHGDV